MMKIISLSVLIASFVISSCGGNIDDSNTSEKTLVNKDSYGLFHEKEGEIKIQLNSDSFNEFAEFR